MSKSNKSSKVKNKVKVNFAGVETRANIDEGQYHCKVAETSVEEGNQAPYIKWVFEIVEDGKHKGRKLFTNTSLAPQALWNLRNLLETLGVEVPDAEMSLDLDACKGLELMVSVSEEVYEGKSRPKVVDYTPLEEAADVEDDERTEKSDDDDEEEETEEKSDDEEEEEEEETSDDEEKSDDDEEEEDEDDGKVKADEVREMDEKELADLVKQHKLKIDLNAIPKKGKKIGAVLDALEKKGLLSK